MFSFIRSRAYDFNFPYLHRVNSFRRTPYEKQKSRETYSH